MKPSANLPSGKPVKAAHDKDLTHVWRKLQSADHFHYMQKENSFTPYASAFDAYIYYMNALADLQIRVKGNLENRFSRIRKSVLTSSLPNTANPGGL